MKKSTVFFAASLLMVITTTIGFFIFARQENSTLLQQFCLSSPRVWGDTLTFPNQAFNSENKTMVNREDVSLVIQSDMSDFRLARIEKNLQRWSGPVTIALIQYPENVDWQQRHRIQQRFYRPNVKVYFYETQRDLATHYPFNVMRNAAISLTETNFIFLIDADFIVSHGIYEHLRSESVRNTVSEKIMYIVPAFDVFLSEEEFDRIHSKKDFLQAKQKYGSNIIDEVHRKTHIHHFLDYDRWEKTHQDYYVTPTKKKNPEPFGMVPRSIPRYDEMFVGRGYDKQSQMWMVRRLGYKFMVCSSHFISHLPHKKQKNIKALFQSNVKRFHDLQSKFTKALMKGTTHY